MSLTDFSIHSPSTVILADNRDAGVSWQRHLRDAGPGRGGVDVVAPVGTPVYAWADGTVTRQPNNGTAGNVARLHLEHDPGWILDYKHLSSYVDLVNGRARKGQVIGYSGQSGAPGQPHVHYNLVDPQGNRQNPWLYVSGTAQSGTPASVTQKAEEDHMIRFINPPQEGDKVYASGPDGRLWVSPQQRDLSGRYIDRTGTLNLREIDIARDVCARTDKSVVRVVWDALTGYAWLCGWKNRLHLSGPDLSLIQRWDKADPKDPVLLAEIDIVSALIRRVR